MIDFIKSISWTTEQWALVVSIIALVGTLIFNIVSYRLSQKALRLELQKYKEERAEKEKNVLDISVWHSNKVGGDSFSPLKWIGIWLKVNNRSDEQPILAQVKVEIYLKKEYRHNPKDNFIIDLIKFLFIKPREDCVEFYLYRDWKSYTGELISVSNLEMMFFPLNFYLIDWESKSPIYFIPRKEYRMPLLPEKKIWFLFGIIPESVATEWKKIGYSLDRIRLIFSTDQSDISITERINTNLLSDKDLQEYMSYKFGFEPA